MSMSSNLTSLLVPVQNIIHSLITYSHLSSRLLPLLSLKTDQSSYSTASTMSHDQPSTVSSSSMPHLSSPPSQQNIASPRQTPKLTESTNGSSDSKSLIEAMLSQPHLKDRLEDMYREMGLGENICAALQKSSKRGIEEVSGTETSSFPKKSKVKKPKKADPSANLDQMNSDQTNSEQKNSEQKKSEEELRKKEKYIRTCISCRETRHVNQFPRILPSSSCEHGREMCRMCIIAWIRTQVQDGKVPRCALCSGTISYACVEGITKKKWDKDILTR